MNGRYSFLEFIFFLLLISLYIATWVFILRWVFRINTIVLLLEKIVKTKEADEINLRAIRDYVKPECKCSLCQKPNERLTFVNNKLLCKDCIHMIMNHQKTAAVKDLK